MLSSRRLDREPPAGHETETTETRTDTEGTLTTELDSNETERLVTRRDQGKVGTGEQIRRQGSELGLGVDAVGVHLHETGELLGGETTVEINDGTDTDELDLGLLLEQGRHDVGDEVDTLLLGPTTDEHEQVGVGVLPDTCPLLRLALELGTLGLGVGVDLDLVDVDLLVVEGSNIRRVGVRERVNVTQSPERGITSPRTLSVLVRHTGDTNRLLVVRDERGGGVQEVERVAKLDVLGAHVLGNVERRAHLLHLLLRAQRPETLELGIVQRETDGHDLGKQVEGSEGTMVVVDVVDVNVREAADRLGNGLVPG